MSLHPAEQYVADVLAGRVLVGKHVRRAVQRHTGLAYIAWTMDWNGAWGTTSK